MVGKKFHGYDWIEIAPNKYTFNTPGNKYIVDFENQGNDDYNVDDDVYADVDAYSLLSSSCLLVRLGVALVFLLGL